jgi:hypothetical protein
MTQAEEAGQQPTRPAPAQAGERASGPEPALEAGEQACAAGTAEVMWHLVSAEDIEELEQKITREDLRGPDDPAELALVEKARQRLADLALLEELAASKFRGVAFDMFVIELAAYGIATLMVLMRTRQIVRQCLLRGRPLVGGLPSQWSRDDRLEIASETTAIGLRYFTEEVLEPMRWDPHRGASVKTFFVGSCILQFPNVYNRWRTQEQRWSAVEVIEPGTEEAAQPGPRNSGWSDPTAETAIREVLTREILRDIEDPQTRTAAEMVRRGYRLAEIGAVLGMSADAVGARLYRLRKRAR